MMEKKQLIDTINDVLNFALSNLHTSTIAKVVKVNNNTVDVQPVINRVVDGESKTLTVFSKVPPVFMQGGGSYLSFPLAVGDYCLLIITERCFDRWYDGADNQSPAEMRMFDYSDGMAIFGVNPKASAITIPEVITLMGDAYHEGDMERDGDLIQTGDIELTGSFNQTGNMAVSGAGAFGSLASGNGATGTVTAGGFDITITSGIVTGLVPV